MDAILLKAIIASLVLFAICISVESSQVVLSTKLGQIRGSQIQEVYEFIGIPFAEPPTGERRFQKPVLKAKWNDEEILDATKPPPACSQLPTLYTSSDCRRDCLVPGTGVSEDCLYLNLWVPRKAIDNLSTTRNKKMPVFMFIYGGGFVAGTTMIDTYNGSALAAHGDIIVATIAYRVGILGFGYFGTEDAPGNMGLWDQLGGLRWIHENIDGFGGDPSAVTIAGESAGAASVSLHLLSPYSRPYFQRAIIESGTALSPWAVYPKETARSVTEAIVQEVRGGECSSKPTLSDQLACLRSLPTEEMGGVDAAALAKSLGYAPVVDGDFIPNDPKEMLANGEFSDVPLLIGANNNEGSLFMLLVTDAMEITMKSEQPGSTLSLADYNRLLNITVTLLTARPQILDPTVLRAAALLYWPRDDGFLDGRQIVYAAEQATGDYGFTCPTYHWAQQASTKAHVTVFAYNFNYRASVKFLPDWTAVTHGAELPMVFGEPFLPQGRKYGYSQEDEMASRTVMTYWSNFVKLGDPNGDGNCHLPNSCNELYWAPFSTEKCRRQIFQLNAESMPENCDFKARHCSFWDDVFRQLSTKIAKCG